MNYSNKKTIAEPENPLRDAVADLYRAFRRYQAPSTQLDVCLNCCMSADLEAEMRSKPLRSLYRDHFYEYNTSAKNTVQSAEEVTYFVPRMCELLVEGVDIHHSVELYLDRLGRCPVGSLSREERAALDGFALVYFAEALKQPLYQEGGLFQRDDAMTTLLMFAIGGIDIDPLLAHWETDAASPAVVHFAHTACWSFWHYGGVVTNAFADDRADFTQKIDTWMRSPRVRQMFAERILTLATTAPAGELAAKYSCCRTIGSLLDDAYQYVAP